MISQVSLEVQFEKGTRQLSDKDLLLDTVVNQLQVKSINVCTSQNGGVTGLQFTVDNENGTGEKKLHAFGDMTNKLGDPC